MTDNRTEAQYLHFVHTIDQIRKTLTYLLEIWQKIESSPYRLGLFNFKEKPCHSRLN